jgi:hypothetical protein
MKKDKSKMTITATQSERMPEWLAELSTAWWRKTVVLVLSIFMTIGGWMLLQVVAFPKDYASKDDLRCSAMQLQEMVRDGFSRQEKAAKTNGDKIDELNRYLRERR